MIWDYKADLFGEGWMNFFLNFNFHLQNKYKNQPYFLASHSLEILDLLNETVYQVWLLIQVITLSNIAGVK